MQPHTWHKQANTYAQEGFWLILARTSVRTNNASADAAMEWLIAHMEDADIDAPLVTASAPAAKPAAAGNACVFEFYCISSDASFFLSPP